MEAAVTTIAIALTAPTVAIIITATTAIIIIVPLVPLQILPFCMITIGSLVC